jgi:menaquinol-cytochrome c reductase iron-sulfur subunit
MDRPPDTVGNAAEAPLDRPMTRNRFLAWTGGIAAGMVATALGVIGLPPIVAPALRDGGAGWTALGPIDGSEPGQPDLSVAGTVVPTSFTRTVTDAFMLPEKQKTPVFLVCEGGDRFTVFDARCTHLGCPLSWSSTDREFLCACHGAVYDQGGEVTDGPPPRPLDRYETKVEDGILYVGRLHEGES